MADSKVFIIAEAGVNHNGDVEKAVKEKVSALCARFPIYPTL